MEGCPLIINGQSVASAQYIFVHVCVEDLERKDPLAIEPRHFLERKAIGSYGVPNAFYMVSSKSAVGGDGVAVQVDFVVIVFYEALRNDHLHRDSNGVGAAA